MSDYRPTQRLYGLALRLFRLGLGAEFYALALIALWAVYTFLQRLSEG